MVLWLVTLDGIWQDATISVGQLAQHLLGGDEGLVGAQEGSSADASPWEAGPGTLPCSPLCLPWGQHHVGLIRGQG